MDRNELLTSIYSTAADVQRWSMQMATAGRVSADRCTDIRHATQRINVLVSKLEESR